MSKPNDMLRRDSRLQFSRNSVFMIFLDYPMSIHAIGRFTMDSERSALLRFFNTWGVSSMPARKGNI